MHSIQNSVSKEEKQMSEKLLDVKNLHTSFFTHLGEVQAIRDVSFGLDKGEILVL